MRSLALECPVPFMGDLVPLTDFDFILAHLWEGIPGYKDWYLDQSKRNGRTIVLDNGTNEMGFPLSIQEMDEVAQVLEPSFIVPPDFLGEGEKTLQSLEEARKVWGSGRLIPVIQGKDSEEALRSYLKVRSMGFQTVSIPYDICVSDRSTPLYCLADTRKTQIAQMVEAEGENPEVQIHLLGLNTLDEVSYYRKYIPEVVSLDTGAPFLNASLGVRFGRDPLVPKGIYIDYHKPRDQYSQDTLRLARENILHLKELMDGE